MGLVKVINDIVLSAGTKILGKVGIDQETANANEVVTKSGSVVSATISGSDLEIFGADLSTRPDAGAVPVGTYFIVVAAGPNYKVYQTNGTDWIEVA
jgi:hypothetical protein